MVTVYLAKSFTHHGETKSIVELSGDWDWEINENGDGFITFRDKEDPDKRIVVFNSDEVLYFEDKS